MRAIRWIVICTWSLLTGFTNPEDGSVHRMEEMLHYRLMTDRSLYVAGEEIGFRVFNLSAEVFRKEGWSRVYYLEFISPRGESLVRMKLPLDASGTSGAFQVPRQIPTGTYYLKGYTRWLRNLGPETYTYLSVEVINPVVKTVLPVDTVSSFTVALNRFQEGSSGQLPPEAMREIRVQSRSEVMLDIDNEPAGSLQDGCVTVAREEALAGQREYSRPVVSPESGSTGYIPEIRGVSLTGEIRFADRITPAPYAKIYVTAMDEQKSFYCNFCDSLGRFYLAMNDMEGENDLFISAFHPETQDLEILVDQDFCNEPVLLPSYPITLNREKEALIEELCVNAQIGEHYAQETRGSGDTAEQSEKFFYGAPSSTVRFDDFIRLPAFEEYITEVVPQVTLRKIDGKRKFRVLGSDPELQFYDPLLMVDGVAVFDEEVVLGISPRYIDRIELVTAPYIRGSVTFGGIVNLITRDGNMGYIDLPSSGLLVEYEMFSVPVEPFTTDIPIDPRIPDVRNTLWWKPSAGAANVGGAIVRFRTSDGTGKYLIQIRGYDSEDQYMEEEISLLVD